MFTKTWCEQVAQVCHNVNTQYCLMIGDQVPPRWHELTEEEQASMIAGVAAKMQKPEITPEQQHNLWMESKIADGWSYGEVKDRDRKLHPCLVPYSELPEKQRMKDILFGSTVVGIMQTTTFNDKIFSVEDLPQGVADILDVAVNEGLVKGSEMFVLGMINMRWNWEDVEWLINTIYDRINGECLALDLIMRYNLLKNRTDDEGLAE